MARGALEVVGLRAGASASVDEGLARELTALWMAQRVDQGTSPEAAARAAAEGRLREALAGRIQSWVSRRLPSEGGADHAGRERFIEGWLSATLLFCVGPLTILGSLSDGLGRGIDQLALKAVLDGFAAMAFASTFGIGVLLSAVSIAVIQGSITLVGVLLGSVMPEPHIAALTATGGLLLAGIGLRLLRIKDVPVGDMLPALVVAPLLTHLVIALR